LVERKDWELKPSEFKIRGVITALVTPFDDQGLVDESALKRLVEYQIRAGVHGLNPCGTTGEHALLTPDERRHIAEIVVQTAHRRVPVFVQTGTASTEMTIALTRHAQEIGADAATVVTPYYYHPTDEGMIEHYARVAESVPDLPIFLYNIPQLTGNNLSPALVAAIVERCPNVVGMKDSSGDLQQVIDSVALRGGRFNIAMGSDGLVLSALVAGVQASVSGNANVFPELFVELFQAYGRGDLSAAQSAQARIQHVRRILKDGSDLSLYKAILARRGLPVGGVRAPLVNAERGAVDACVSALDSVGLEVKAIS
jgi:4-hydroxy-tetrahydrodipicolinate synthase